MNPPDFKTIDNMTPAEQAELENYLDFLEAKHFEEEEAAILEAEKRLALFEPYVF